MEMLSTENLATSEILEKIKNARSSCENVKHLVAPIMEDVKKNGDSALRRLTERFDKVKLTSLKVSPEEFEEARGLVSPEVSEALKVGYGTIEKFHRAMYREKEEAVETAPGVKLWREFRPIEKVGLYAPGGLAAYPSTVLMLGIPAKIAGCSTIVLCTPPMPDGKVQPSVLVAAQMCGIETVFKIGGSQAIAAMAYGTETVPAVYKVLGPGSQFISTAKTMVADIVAFDMPAGPSEVMVIADESANPEWVAADLMAQLEHGPDSQSVLVTFDKATAERVKKALLAQFETAPRKEIIKNSLAKSFAVVIKNPEEAIEIANEYASEHLEIIVDDQNVESQILAGVTNAGSIFLGKWSAESYGDYCSGGNHTLPTSGFAKMFAGVSTDSFGKWIQVQRLSEEGARSLKRTVEVFAQCEGLPAHGNAATLRFK